MEHFFRWRKPWIPLVWLTFIVCLETHQSEITFTHDKNRLKWQRFLFDFMQSGEDTNTVALGENCRKFPEACMNVSQIIRYRGYPVEEYTVQTEDGFLLGVQRIPHGRSGNEAMGQKPVVLLQHGLLCSATDWVINYPNESLAFILADAGFDVWLGNSRGNTYSRRHIKYSVRSPDFWAWSWDEMANYDLPATLDFILHKTNTSKLQYVGHSQGTLIAFAAFSKHHDLTKKIDKFFALAPVTTTSHVKGLIPWLAMVQSDIVDLFKLFGVHEFLPSNALLRFLSAIFCSWETVSLCEDCLFIIVGFDGQELNKTRLPVYTSQTPAGTSVQNMVHFAQMVRSGNFQMYDYGSAKLNKQHYNQSTAPLYDVSKMVVPTVIFSAGNDWLADPDDVRMLVSRLPNLLHHYNIADWDHLDFIWGMNANKIVYQKIIDIIKSP